MDLRKKAVYLLIGLFILALAACVPQNGQLPETGDEQTPEVETPAVESPVAETPAVSPELPPEEVLNAQRWLAEQLDVPVEEVEIISQEQVEWTDSCLGLGQPNESCAQVITPGWQAIFEVDGQEYEVRTDETGAAIRSPQFTGQPPEAVLAAQTWLAEQLVVPVGEVMIVSQEQAEWTDSCLGLGQPNESCLQVITPGWLVMFEVDGQEYEVRTDETGEVIRSPQITGQPEAGDELANSQWRLESFGEPGAETPVIEGTEVTLEFEAGGQAGGSGGCNSFGGQYEVSDGMLSFGEIVTTEIACLEEGVMEQEQAYYEALQAAGEYELADDQLTIRYDDGQGVLNFTRIEEDAPGSELANTQWRLVSFGEPGAEAPVVEGSEVTLEFGEDGQAGGSSGCNSFGGQYEIQDSTLSFNEIVSTLMACADEAVMEQEASYITALQTAGEFELTGDRLTIQYNEGQGVLNFVRPTVEPPPVTPTP